MKKYRYYTKSHYLLKLMIISIITGLFFMGTLVIADQSPTLEVGISEYAKSSQDQSRKTPKKSHSTTDHSSIEKLQGPFTTGPEVTKACLECHNEVGRQFMKNIHWTWDYKHPKTGQHLGKSVLVNNYCINARGNEGMCAQCHAGYNMTNSDFDFSNQENIDCLICHESTGTYYKTPTTKGNKACVNMFKDKPEIEWAKIAQSVALPSRNNCGVCHFFGGGGDNVKHGDLSSVLFDPPRDVDIHMSAEGENFTCVTCHVGEGHEWAGSRYEMLVNDTVGMGKPGMVRKTASCESCHGASPHPIKTVNGMKLNGHTDRVACETCHIPEIAKGGVATKIDWDWRSMGQLKNGKSFKLKEYTQGDGQHRATYKTIKGSLSYAENLQPMYAWFDGTMHYTTIDSQFDPALSSININSFSGSREDPNSRIYPFKRMHMTQPYDKGNNTLIYMHLWGDDDNALWGNFDFSKAIQAGMEENNAPYSGEWGFIETYSYWPINHMVAPKEEALVCADCHVKGGRISHLTGLYIPGAGGDQLLDYIYYIAIFGTLGGVLGHGVIKSIATNRRKNNV